MREQKLSFKTRTAVLLPSTLCLCYTPIALAQVETPQTPTNSAAPVSSSAPKTADGAGTTSGTVEEKAAATPEAEEPPATTLAAGLDIYAGISNLDGQKRISDGFWAAGSGVAYPSIAYLNYQNKNGSAAKLSIGTGDIYRGPNRTVNQPVEAWYQQPLGKYTVTAGKYWVPFALQEWQYETKYGVQLQRDVGASNVTSSVNYDHITHKPNAYFRVGRDFNEKANAGISLAAGEGLSYGSIHNKAVGLDLSLQSKNFKLYSEAVSMQRRSSDRFRFFYTKIVYDKLPKVKPFVGYYRWNDKSGAFGDLRSLAYGGTYELRPELVVEGGGAKTRDQNVYWIQLHLMLEKQIYKQKPAMLPLVAGMPRLNPSRD